MFGYVAVLLLMVLTISMLFTNGFGSNTRDRRITYPQLLTMIEEGQVRSVAIRGTSLVGVTTTTTVADADFPDKNYDFETIIGADFIVTARQMQAAKLNKPLDEVSVKDLPFTIIYRQPLTTPWWYDLIPLAISLVLCGVMFWLIMRAQTGGNGKVMNFGRSRARIHDPNKNKVTFADVAGAEFLADAQVEFPTVSTEELQECMFRDVLGTFTTKCAGPWGRHQNIKLASAAINGKIYNPGEEFWYNSTVGQRTAARGYQEAGVYEAGRTTTGIGGGICQVSSTLYYAVLLSDLDIVLRYCHMFNPGYMPIGCDATVSWGGPDFAFRNSRDYPIKIVTSYNDDTNELTCTILGTKVDDHYVVMTNAVLASYDYQTVYQESPDVAPGEEVIDQYGHTGYHVRTWRNIYDGDGNLLSSRVEADSHYDVGNKIILVAPGYLPEDNA